jgi:hypothetical protein
VKVKFLMTSIEELFGYPVKYRKAWMAKANAIRMLHGDYEAAYNILPKMLAAIAHRNPGMRHRVESIDGVFRRAFWSPLGHARRDGFFLVTEPMPPLCHPLPPSALAVGSSNLPPAGVAVGLKTEQIPCSAPHLRPNLKIYQLLSNIRMIN